MLLKKIKQELRKQKDLQQAKVLAKFFKTARGQYGYGDKFLGVRVPSLRLLAKKYISLGSSDIKVLLSSKYHEERLLGALILVYQFNVADDKKQKDIYNFYLKNWASINNWDLVDTTTPNIVGEYLLDKDKKILYAFARSNNLWKKRMAIIATFSFIKRKQFTDTLLIARILLTDKHDLIHKAVGWMLREVGKRDLGVEECFLQKWCKKMPRTMLRYAIEKFPENKRQYYLKMI
jgi:3-methyladenine DNA glycosylase AlkD